MGGFGALDVVVDGRVVFSKKAEAACCRRARSSAA